MLFKKNILKFSLDSIKLTVAVVILIGDPYTAYAIKQHFLPVATALCSLNQNPL